jgi:hypothetical protein
MAGCVAGEAGLRLTRGSRHRESQYRFGACALSEQTINGHRPDVVDVAHGRWATTGCITALDLFAAALARVFCGHSATRELSIADFTTKKKAAPLFAQLPVSAQQWIGSAAADGDYQTVKLLRDSLVHARVRRHFTMPRQRLQIQAGAARLAIPTVVTLSRDTAEGPDERLPFVSVTPFLPVDLRSLSHLCVSASSRARSCSAIASSSRALALPGSRSAARRNAATAPSRRPTPTCATP